MGRGRTRSRDDALECIKASMNCGNGYPESLEFLNRTEAGEFRPGDILFIRAFTIIDWDPESGEYGRIHNLENHKYLVVGNDKGTEEKGDLIADYDLQLVLLDGVHQDTRTDRPLHPLIPTDAGLDDEYVAKADRLIKADSVDLKDRKARINSRIRRKNGKERLGEIQKIAFGKGKEKPNAENLRYRKKEKREEHDL